MQWAEIDGRRRLLVAGTVNRFIPNPTFDPVARPGSLDEYFRGRNPRGRGHRRAVRRPRADPPRVPGPRRPPGRDGRPGDRRLLPVPDPGRRHGGGAGRRPRGRCGRLPRLQPVARGRLGLRLPRPDLRGPDDPPGRRGRRRGRARTGAEPGRPDRLHQERAGHHPDGRVSPGRRPVRPVLGPGRRGRRDGRDPLRRRRVRPVHRRLGTGRDVPGLPPTRRCASC